MADENAVCKHPRGFTALRMTRMCCPDCGSAPGKCEAEQLWETPNGVCHLSCVLDEGHGGEHYGSWLILGGADGE